MKIKTINFKLLLKRTRELFFIVFILCTIRFFAFSLGICANDSMIPNVFPRDIVITTTYSYGFNPLSIAYTPASWAYRIFESDPHVGEIIIIRIPENGNNDSIKRLIGKEGDKIKLINGILHINGNAVKVEEKEPYTYLDIYGTEHYGIIAKETLPNGLSYNIFKSKEWGTSPKDNFEEITVPKDHYFIISDNRDISDDSYNFIGCVHKKYLIGKPQNVLFNLFNLKSKIMKTIR